MGSQIDALLEKYWNGETSLQEERILKEHFKKDLSNTSNAQFFNMLSKEQKRDTSKRFVHPGKSSRQTWLSLAASLLVGVSVAFWVINDARKQREYVIEDPQEAYEMTRKALMLVSRNLNEGAEYSKSISNIEKAKTIISEKKDDK